MAIRVPRLGYKETSLEGWVQNTVRDPLRMSWPKPSSKENVYRPGYVPFSALDLFAPTDDGFYFDFSKTDRTFQASSGELLADDDTEPVAVALDSRLWGGKTYNAVMATQPQLLTTVADKTSYLLNNATIDDPGGILTITATATSNNRAYKNVATTAGKSYEATVEVLVPSTNTTVNAGRIIAIGITSSSAPVEDMWVERTIRFMAISTTASIAIECASGSSWGAIGDKTQFRNLSCREIPGNHAIQSASTSFRPTRQAGGILRWDGIDDYLLPNFNASQSISFFIKAKAPTVIRMFGGSRTSSNVDNCFLQVDTSGFISAGLGAQSAAVIKGSVNRFGQTGIYGFTHQHNGLDKLYDRGSEVYSGPVSGSITNGKAFALGALNTNGTMALFGNIDAHFAMAINRALTPSEVANLVNDWS